MRVRINRFFFDGKDIFIIGFGLTLIIYYFFNLHIISYVQYQSLMVLFLFLVVVRTLVTQTKLSEYVAIVVLGLLFSFILSPGGMCFYLIVGLLLYHKLF